LTHPTIDGDWILPRHTNIAGVDRLLADMNTSNISHALAVGMKGIGSYDNKKYMEFLKPYLHRLIPIAFFDLSAEKTLASVTKELAEIKKLGYKGIKLHSRQSDFSLQHPLLAEVIMQANDKQLAVLLCTYFYDKTQNASFNNIERLMDLLFNVHGAKVILAHAGSVRLLETMEIARVYSNVLLDLSFTLNKYCESSLDLNIQYLFKQFDRRICVGSDFPDFSPTELRFRFEKFAAAVDPEKAANIAYKNLFNFLNIKYENLNFSESDKNEVITRYSNRYKEFGYSPKSLGWAKGKQDIRFDILTSQYDFNNKCILDIGCGFGDLNKTLEVKAKNFKYLGVDLVEDFIKHGQKIYNKPYIHFIVDDFSYFNTEMEIDYAVSSGMFNFKLKEGDNYLFIENTIARALEICKDGLAFDFLSDKVDYQYEQTFHSNPEKILAIAYKYSRNVLLRNDYMPFEFSLFIFKDQYFSKENTVFERFLMKKKY
jgi:predicted TIM-barrel fold metal-dependent hydrolase